MLLCLLFAISNGKQNSLSFLESKSHSADKWAITLLAYLQKKDTTKLWQLGISSRLFKELYPLLPEGKKASLDQTEFAWTFFRQDNEKMLLRILEYYGATRFQFINWKFSDTLILSNQDTLFKNCTLNVKDTLGKEHSIFWIKSIYRSKSGYKVWSWNADKPIRH